LSELYLQPNEDSLPMRQSQDYARDKLTILRGYVHRFVTSMRDKRWRALFFIDLMAGPGKNKFEPSGAVMLGSPLIALTAQYSFTHYRFVEIDPHYADALNKRVSASERRDAVKVIKGNCNEVVDKIVEEIRALDKPYIPDSWPCLSLAFLDPEGLELNWETVRKLGQMKRMDLIINFSTSGFTRNVEQLIEKETSTRIDSFFGTPEWKDVYRKVADKDGSHVRREMLDFYKKRLAALGYTIHPEERTFHNRNNTQIYTLIFASKHDLGNDFWSGAIQEVSQPKLL